MNKLKASAFVMALLGVSFVYANEVYVEQIGSSSNITINQDGTGNKVGDSVTPAFIGGGSNVVNIDQIGSGNVLAMVMNGAAATATVSTTGSGNTQTINCGTTISAGCSSAAITQTINGDNNTVTQNLGSGANHVSNINVSGSANNITHTSTNVASAGSSAHITVVGDTNNIGVTQSGMVAKTVVVNSTGNLNNINITQAD